MNRRLIVIMLGKTSMAGESAAVPVGATAEVLVADETVSVARSGADDAVDAGACGVADADGLAGGDADDGLAERLREAKEVVIIPGYGMALAQAQGEVRDLAEQLEAVGARVRYAIHPVAGRMPGHMNVLLAEADIPYEQLKTMDEINPLMQVQDVAIVIGANDVVNPAAETDSSSPIYGMPIIKAYEAKTVFVLKRGKGKGFSGIENELFSNQNTLMLYGDAKATISSLAGEFTVE
jgi:NAD/NADP transhydrogenase beta subunit